LVHTWVPSMALPFTVPFQWFLPSLALTVSASNVMPPPSALVV
jgi:hypothetical protein